MDLPLGAEVWLLMMFSIPGFFSTNVFHYRRICFSVAYIVAYMCVRHT